MLDIKEEMTSSDPGGQDIRIGINMWNSLGRRMKMLRKVFNGSFQ